MSKGLVHLFVIARVVNGRKEVLKASNSQKFKTFSDYNTADALAQKINVNTQEDKRWHVKEIKTQNLNR